MKTLIQIRNSITSSFLSSPKYTESLDTAIKYMEGNGFKILSDGRSRKKPPMCLTMVKVDHEDKSLGIERKRHAVYISDVSNHILKEEV